MKRLPVARIGLALFVCWSLSSTGWADPRSPFESELARLAGRGAAQCGLIALRQDPKPEWICAMGAESKAQPFWFALQRQGEDSEVWMAAIRTPAGEHVILNYDSNRGGGRGLDPSFYQTRCPGAIVFRPLEFPPLK